MGKFKIDRKEWILALSFAILGFFLSMHKTVLFLDELSPFMGFLLYYGSFYLVLYFLSRLELVIFSFHIKKPIQIIGTLLITISLFIVINYESPYVNIITGREPSGSSNILYQSEDGATWYLWQKAGFENVDILRWLTYIITPFILTLFGSLLISRKIEISG